MVIAMPMPGNDVPKSIRAAVQRLGAEELSPRVDLAGCWYFHDDVAHRYRIPSHHLILVESGEIKARTPYGSLAAKAGDLICFRPAEVNHYRNCGPTLFYQAH